MAGDEDRDAPALAPPADLPVHLEAPRDLRLERSCRRSRSALRCVRTPRGRTRCAGRSARRWDRRSTGGRRRCWRPARTGSPRPRPRSPGGRHSRSTAARCSAVGLSARARRDRLPPRGSARRLTSWTEAPVGRSRLAGRRRGSPAARWPLSVLAPVGFFLIAASSVFRCALFAAGARLTAFSEARSPTRVLCAL